MQRLTGVNELYVDDPDKDSGGKIEVNLNISLPNLHCELIGLDIQDEMGRHEVGHIDNSMKIPLNNGDGCRFEGHFSINKASTPTSHFKTKENAIVFLAGASACNFKVPGNFHVSTHSATAQPQNPDMTHVIHKLSFGDKLQVQNIHGAFNALEGADKLSSNPLASHDYILKIVPTVYEDMSGKQRYSYQYTVANKEYVAYSHTGRIIPAIWFRYDLSPITVKYTERRQPLYRFITTPDVIPAVPAFASISSAFLHHGYPGDSLVIIAVKRLQLSSPDRDYPLVAAGVIVKYGEIICYVSNGLLVKSSEEGKGKGQTTEVNQENLEICAIIGGTFTVAGILDSCIFTASEAWKKIQLGKMQ
ncbi:hypothetical protein JD844_012005 [Phrynosoma platyrhinos]|uniref:Endoplasmic reticulum-Golgi intermediate compartment protein n=1 Tax=Phrynosoma platyrhinos TaxID=52577 RepID=A0ABQ7TIX6_PHRPL|nr:hypothetical protein JD844_012005 [Phrynosoma platyrhinos]